MTMWIFGIGYRECAQCARGRSIDSLMHGLRQEKAKVWQCYLGQWLKQVLMTPKAAATTKAPTLTPDNRGVGLAHYHNNQSKSNKLS